MARLKPPYRLSVAGDPMCDRCLIPLDFQVMREVGTEAVTMLWASCQGCRRTTDAVPLPKELSMDKVTSVIREGAKEDGSNR